LGYLFYYAGGATVGNGTVASGSVIVISGKFMLDVVVVSVCVVVVSSDCEVVESVVVPSDCPDVESDVVPSDC
jgi:hypothetical protein